ncbi:unnamed protein product, partial [Vitis vinifera]|uniref:SHSP domain-containing protein n=1 Tax=Vitis vinifera TaxID=29760 RepID=D7TMJ8_VITVI
MNDDVNLFLNNFNLTLSLLGWEILQRDPRCPEKRDRRCCFGGHYQEHIVGETSAFANTRIDWKETPEAHIFKANLPGLRKEEEKVEVEEGRVLQISGERSKEQEEKNDKWHRVEMSSGRFLRRFRLLENVKTDEVKACMENGVLIVMVSKEEVKKAKVKAIEISG